MENQVIKTHFIEISISELLNLQTILWNLKISNSISNLHHTHTKVGGSPVIGTPVIGVLKFTFTINTGYYYYLFQSERLKEERTVECQWCGHSSKIFKIY